jgi:hypothetical protein
VTVEIGCPSDRVFHVWAFNVGHVRLLLRSTKVQQFPGSAVGPRLEVMFVGVDAVQLPGLFRDLLVSEADDQERLRIAEATGLNFAGMDRAYVVTGRTMVSFYEDAGEFRGYVVGAGVASSEGDGEYFEPSPLWIDENGFV